MLLAQAQVMNGLRRQFLSGAAFSQQQYRRFGRRNASDVVVELLHRRRRAEHLSEMTEPTQFATQHADLFLQIDSARYAR
jgi:hypothetical protein